MNITTLVILLIVNSIILPLIIRKWLRTTKIQDRVLDLKYPFNIVFSCSKCLYFWSSLISSISINLILPTDIYTLSISFFILFISNTISIIKNNRKKYGV